MEEEKKQYKSHVIVIPYPSQGHINPLLQFAKRLSSKGIKATFATTPYTLSSISAPSISLESISDGFDLGGFSQARNTDVYLKSFKTHGSKTLSQLIEKYNSSSTPIDCVVYDSFFPWALDVAKQHGLFGAPFFTNSVAVCAVFCRIHLGVLGLPVMREELPLVVPGLPPLSFNDLPSFFKAPESYPAYLAMKLNQYSNLDEADWVFCNSFEELEGEDMANLLELFGYEPPEAHLLPNQLEGWGDSESLVRQAHPTLDHLMGRSVYLQADPDEDLLFWRLSRDSTRERYIGPTHVVGLAPDIEPPHFLVAPLPVGFAERRGPAYPSSHLRTTTPPPQHIVYTPAVDFTDGASYLETPIRITGREFWGYDHGAPVYVVQVVWSCFGVELSGWEFESIMQSEFPELFHGPVFRG